VKPPPFAYHAPSTVAEAVGLLTEHGDDAKAWLAWWTSHADDMGPQVEPKGWGS